MYYYPGGDTPKVPLTDVKTRTAKALEKSYKLSDEKGLFLYITPQGGKYWRLKYRFLNKEKLLALGVYPDVSLANAREQRDEARKLLAKGIDPSARRRIMKRSSAETAANSFEIVAREWFAKHETSWVKSHSDKIIRRLERDIFPWLGKQPISNITAPDLLCVLRRVEARGAVESARRLQGNCSQIFRYAIATSRVERDPARDLRGAIPPLKTKHFAAQTTPQGFSSLLKACESYQGSFVVKCALRLAALWFVRPGELRNALWSNIDFEKAEWRYTVTKTGTQLIVPIATQALSILQELQPFTKHSIYVFPSAYNHKRPMSNNAVLTALRRMGIEKSEATGHGFRAAARTLLDEVLSVRPDLIECQLAHAVRDPNGRAYNRTAYLPERRKMMQDWADYIDSLISM